MLNWRPDLPPVFRQSDCLALKIMNKMLYVDMLPKSTWGKNLRELLTEECWNSVKKKTYAIAQYRCEICSGRGMSHPVECHERWDFNVKTKTQTLTKTIALCPKCHTATHFGFATMIGKQQEAKNHLMNVNNWTRIQVEEHINESIKNLKELEKTIWTLDARWILDFVDISKEGEANILKKFNEKSKEIA
jgi:hypothetical protein